MYVQVLELKVNADASHSQLMMLCASRSQGGCLKKGEASWRDPVAGAALFAQLLKQPGWVCAGASLGLSWWPQQQVAVPSGGQFVSLIN